MRKYLFGAFLMLTVLAIACKKDKGMSKATVIDTVDVAKGGCGYLLRMENGDEVRPRYMPSAFQHDGMKVKVKLNRDGGGEVCNTYPTKKFIEVADLTDIKKDLD